MIQPLLHTYEVLSTELVDLEKQKQDIELESIDLDSKETMIKLTTKLIRDNLDYKTVVEKIEVTKTKLKVCEKNISVANAMIPLFKEYTSFETWFSQNIKYKG